MGTMLLQAGGERFGGWAAGAMPPAIAENPFARFGVNWYDFASQALAFLIIAWILNRFVFKTVMRIVADRQRAAEEAAASNERIQRELQALEDSRKEVLRKAQEQAERMLAEAKTSAVEMLNQEKQRCEQVGGELLAQARENALLDQARLKTELRTEIASMIVTLTSKLAQTTLQPADRERLIQAAIGEMAGAPEEKG